MKFHVSQRGITLMEMMIALALGLFVVLAATGLLLSSKAGYMVQDQHVQMQETGRYAIEMLARAIRQAGYEHLDVAGEPIRRTADFSPDIQGMDASSLGRRTAGLEAAAASTVVNGSDVLALRFVGDGEAMFNCAGMLVASATSQSAAESERGWSIFFVAKDRVGEPELRCKYRSAHGWNADAIARGIESFQVLYGVDADDDGEIDHFVNADGIDALDDAMTVHGENAIVRLADRNRKTHWKRIRAIRVALLVRSSEMGDAAKAQVEYQLFGDAYDKAGDVGVRINVAAMPMDERKRLRQVYTQTIQLRNAVKIAG